MRSSLAATLFLLMFLATGCTLQRTVALGSAVDSAGGRDSEKKFWRELSRRPGPVTNSDALQAMFLVASADEPPATYRARVAEARGRGWITTDDDPPALESARIGMVAIAVCETLGIEGGATMRLFGPSARYCTRELVYREVIPRRTANQSLTGLELVELVGRIAQYRTAIDELAPVAAAEGEMPIGEEPGDAPADTPSGDLPPDASETQDQ